MRAVSHSLVYVCHYNIWLFCIAFKSMSERLEPSKSKLTRKDTETKEAEEDTDEEVIDTRPN